MQLGGLLERRSQALAACGARVGAGSEVGVAVLGRLLHSLRPPPPAILLALHSALLLLAGAVPPSFAIPAGGCRLPEGRRPCVLIAPAEARAKDRRAMGGVGVRVTRRCKTAVPARLARAPRLGACEAPCSHALPKPTRSIERPRRVPPHPRVRPSQSRSPIVCCL